MCHDMRLKVGRYKRRFAPRTTLVSGSKDYAGHKIVKKGKLP